MECCLFASLSSFKQLSLLSPLLLFFPTFLFISSWICFSASCPLFSVFLSHHCKPNNGLAEKCCHQQPWGLPQCTSLLSLAGLTVGGNPVPGAAGEANKQNTFISWAELAIPLRNSQNPQMGTQRSQAAIEHFCTHFTWCEGWSRSRSRSKIRSSPDESVRVVKQSAFHSEWLYLVWIFSGWILGVISPFLLSGLA